jgi:2-iminobutanoate/2-iminopropanoate deaminase
MDIENITLDDYKTRSAYTLAKKIDLGTCYLLFISGVQTPKKENSIEVVTEDIAEQTRLVFKMIERILKESGATLDDVVKSIIYLTDMNDFDIISPIREEYLKNSLPASTMIEVNRLTREGSKIEVEVTAIIKKEVL